MKRKLRYINIALWGVILTLLCVLLWALGVRIAWTRTVALDKFEWGGYPGLVAARDDDKFSAVRLKDGKDEFLPGSWHVRFTETMQAYLWGLRSGAEFQDVYMLTDRGGVKKDISKFPGPILTIEANPAKTYWLIAGKRTTSLNGKNYYGCVTESDALNLSPCREVMGDIVPDGAHEDKPYRAYWNARKPRELIITPEGWEGGSFVFDPWDDHARAVENSYISSARPYSPAYDARTRQSSPLNWYTVVRQFGPVLAITQKITGKTFLFWAPTFIRPVWVSTDSLVYASGRYLFGLNFETRTRTYLGKLTFKPRLLESFYNPSEE